MRTDRPKRVQKHRSRNDLQLIHATPPGLSASLPRPGLVRRTKRHRGGPHRQKLPDRGARSASHLLRRLLAANQLPEHRTAGPVRVAAPCLRVAGLLRAWHDEQARFVIDVPLNPRKKVEKISPYLAVSDAERQRRRQTWTQSNGKNECRCLPKVVRSPIAQESLTA